MKSTTASRLTGDICLFFCFVSLLPPVHLDQRLAVLFALLAFLVSLFVATAPVQAQIGIFRFIFSLVPGLAVFSAIVLFPALFGEVASVPSLISFAAVSAYVILFLTSGRFYLTADEYKSRIRIPLLACLLIYLANMANSVMNPGLFFSLAAMYWLIGFLFCAIYSLRIMRMVVDMDRHWKLLNLGTTFLFPAFAAIASFLVFSLLKGSLPLIRLILTPVAWLLLKIGRFLVGLFDREGPAEEPVFEYDSSESEIFIPEFQEETGEAAAPAPAPAYSGIDLPEGWQMILLYVLAAIVVILLLWFVIHLIRKGRKQDNESLSDYEETEEFAAENSLTDPRNLFRRRKQATPKRSPASEIRHIYRKYLRLLTSKGMKLAPAMTSADIQHAEPADLKDTASSDLRALYIRARYGSGNSITSEDIECARNCFKQIAEALENRNS